MEQEYNGKVFSGIRVSCPAPVGNVICLIPTGSEARKQSQIKSLFSCLLKGHTLCAFGFLSLSWWCKQRWGCQGSPTDTMLYTQQTLVISLGQNLKLTQCLTFSELCCVPKYGQYYAVLWWKFGLNPTSQNSVRTKSMQTSCQSKQNPYEPILQPTHLVHPNPKPF